ncbi:MAG: FKBP-type peptidyl-prolyl cis-trans isomerase [Sphingobacteriia bacterium]|jgi:FKBP-type peptidyl-prolyl cis-trans isomerase|nr:FKBP-type peptidyl-prolyl cis-trans isomerase [Sphingobacteriia bacterium]
MKNILTLSGVALILISLFTACDGGSKFSGKPENQVDSVSYAIGVNIGSSFRTQKIEVNTAAVLKGLQDGIDSTASMTPDQIREILMALSERMNAQANDRQKAQQGVQGEQNAANGAAFQAEYEKKEGVKKTASGLMYRVIKAGKGKSPKPTDVVSVNYIGRLTDGSEFDSNLKTGQPAKFPLNQVIPGWQEGLLLMKEGDKFEMVIPPGLGYGDQGAGEKIGPQATLVFEVELLKVEATAQP